MSEMQHCLSGTEQLFISVVCSWRQGRKIANILNWNYSLKVLERQQVIIQTEIYLPSNENITTKIYFCWCEVKSAQLL